MSDFLSRARGALVGLAVGDAVGTTNEFKWAGTFEPITDMVGGGPFLLKPGQWTDDTSMALRLAVHGLLDFPSFKDATLAIANMGGDSDTNAAIYGQLGGAFYGIEAIPASWICAWRHRALALTRTCRARRPPPDGSPDSSHPHPTLTHTQRLPKNVACNSLTPISMFEIRPLKSCGFKPHSKTDPRELHATLGV